ncbi:MAG: ABC transporter ATP-binding protein [Burkholderiales bacterium]|nr:ABC transporter ATP-binding protein [Burkholderiales bacterium]
MLAVRDLHAGYGGSEVLHGVDLQVGAGEVVALLGRNGMGKTTLVRAICGLHPARRGEVVFRGERVEAEPAHRIARRGLGLVPEGRQIFANLTVLEHLSAFERARAGPHDVGASAGAPRTGGAAERIARVFELFPRLYERRTNMGNQLSGGEQQMLAIGRALVTEPRLLILDEATEGLAPLVRHEIWRCLAALRASGQAILVIDKYVQRLIQLADRHVILEKGRVAWTGSSAQLDADPSIWQRHLGV